MYANYHTHTYRCNHARGSEREYIERAIARGVRVLGFSDHVPMPFPDGHQSGFRVRIEELEDYVRTLEALREEYIRDFRASMRGILNNTTIVSPDGSKESLSARAKKND